MLPPSARASVGAPSSSTVTQEMYLHMPPVGSTAAPRLEQRMQISNVYEQLNQLCLRGCSRRPVRLPSPACCSSSRLCCADPSRAPIPRSRQYKAPPPPSFGMPGESPFTPRSEAAFLRDFHSMSDAIEPTHLSRDFFDQAFSDGMLFTPSNLFLSEG